MGADHLVFREQKLSLGVAAAGIQRPFVLPRLLDHPGDERLAGFSLAGLAAVHSVGLIDCLPTLWGVAGGFSLAAPAGRCASLQLVCNGAWSAANRSGNGSRAPNPCFFRALMAPRFSGPKCGPLLRSAQESNNW